MSYYGAAISWVIFSTFGLGTVDLIFWTPPTLYDIDYLIGGISAIYYCRHSTREGNRQCLASQGRGER